MGTTTSSLSECTCLATLEDHSSYDVLVARYFQECIYTPIERASFYVGMSSLLFWVMCQLPQFVTNYRNKSADALAALLLIQWLCGDITNLLGSILTKQLAFQKLSALLFVMMDVAMISQKFIYAKGGRWPTRTIEVSGSTQPLLIATVALICLPSMAAAVVQAEPWIDTDSFRMIPSCEPPNDASEGTIVLGNVLGWISSCFYVGSRVAQITKNYQRQSTEGVAPTMFVFAIFGNLTYSLGILLRWERVGKATPWLTGSLMCLSMDIFIVTQSYVYSRRAALSHAREASLSEGQRQEDGDQ